MIANVRGIRVLEGIHNDSMRMGIVVKYGTVGVRTTAEAAAAAVGLKLSGSSWALPVQRRSPFSWIMSPGAARGERREKYRLS